MSDVPCPSARELADCIMRGFDPLEATGLDGVLSRLLRERGFGRYAADEMAYTMMRSVLRELQARRPEELPFRLSTNDETRLIGKKRRGYREDPEAIFAKCVWGIGRELLKHLASVDPLDFEVVCAAALELSGAVQVRALCVGDEGGIDFFGRLPVRPHATRIDRGLVFTTLFPKELLILGQAKRYPLDARIGRPEIQRFKGQLDDCVEKYSRNPHPPSHRAPDRYYERGEAYLGVFVTTASFAVPAEGSAHSNGIVLVHGDRLAQYLAFNRIGVSADSEAPSFDRVEFVRWLAERRRDLVDR